MRCALLSPGGIFLPLQGMLWHPYAIVYLSVGKSFDLTGKSNGRSTFSREFFVNTTTFSREFLGVVTTFSREFLAERDIFSREKLRAVLPADNRRAGET